MDPDGLDNPKYEEVIDPASGDTTYQQICDVSINGVNFGNGIVDDERYGMRRFVYHNNSSGNQGDPQIAPQYYNYLKGIWKDNIYTGPKPKDPEVVRFTNIDKYEFRKGTTNLNRVLIDFRQNGMTNTQVSNIMMTASSGTETKVGQMIGYENLTFPVTFKIRYNSFNKMKTVRYNCYIEFTIYEKGDWVVKLIN
jgi:hypothetical protein